MISTKNLNGNKKKYIIIVMLPTKYNKTKIERECAKTKTTHTHKEST